MEEFVDNLVPDFKGLFKAVQALSEVTDKVSTLHELRGLFHEYFFVQSTI